MQLDGWLWHSAARCCASTVSGVASQQQQVQQRKEATINSQHRQDITACAHGMRSDESYVRAHNKQDLSSTQSHTQTHTQVRTARISTPQTKYSSKSRARAHYVEPVLAEAPSLSLKQKPPRPEEYACGRFQQST
jgi:hypothetical protein